MADARSVCLLKKNGKERIVKKESEEAPTQRLKILYNNYKPYHRRTDVGDVFFYYNIIIIIIMIGIKNLFFFFLSSYIINTII